MSPAVRAALAASLLCLAMLACFWPGIAMFDTVNQYAQLRSGSYDDWHPPAMARLWALFHAAGWPGQAPMFVLQTLSCWAGLGLFAAALARQGARIAAGAVLLLGIWPPIAGWQVAVLKDAQMAGALLAATGLAAWWRLRDLPLPRAAALLIGLLLLYATLVRINAVFATVPLAFGLLGAGTWRRPVRRGAMMLAAMIAVLAVLPLVNHGLLRAGASEVGRALPTYDLAGIAHHAGAEAVPVLPAPVWQAAEAERCIRPMLWDPLGDRCDFVAEGLAITAPGRKLTEAWLVTIARHPVAYAEHRLAHWNATMRWLVPWRYPLAEPQSDSEPNRLGIASPSPRIAPFQRLAGTLAESPLGAPISWLVAALAVLALAWRREDQRSRLAVTLALSAVLTELAFLVISVAADYRYHLWAMLATGLAVALMAGTPLPRRGLRIALAALLLVGATGIAARIALPPVGETYTDAAG
ncbi:hypothetical protein OMP43_14975 [Sphingomonas sp. CBMAI 2297]|uniref:hypothetical protein n=1 Tax=Sphingomonas sp. CBMAI 2297 TaxID=2991720 RepID=UPI002455A0B1|nr:hypothetical protein [Sphingomonas sp. CBMAI 2297]MDH4745323.1 hypothetical protein [Sphingomonas sp. CBMAI 2297]